MIENRVETIFRPSKSKKNCPEPDSCLAQNPKYSEPENETIKDVTYIQSTKTGDFNSDISGKIIINGNERYILKFNPEFKVFNMKNIFLPKLTSKLKQLKSKNEIVSFFKTTEANVKELHFLTLTPFSDSFGIEKKPCHEFICIGGQRNCTLTGCASCGNIFGGRCGVPDLPRDRTDRRTGEPI